MLSSALALISKFQTQPGKPYSPPEPPRPLRGPSLHHLPPCPRFITSKAGRSPSNAEAGGPCSASPMGLRLGTSPTKGANLLSACMAQRLILTRAMSSTAAPPPMPDPTAAERARRYRERKAGRLPAVEQQTCPACGRSHTGARGALCSRCWQSLTPEGRADRAARVAKARAKRKPEAQS